MDKDLNITEEFFDAIKWTITELQKEATATPDDRYVCYLYQDNGTAPEKEDQRRAIKFLEIKETLKIQRNKYRRDLMDDRTAEILQEKPIGVYVSLKQQNFDTFFNLLNKNKTNVTSKENQKHQSLFWVTKSENGKFLFNGNVIKKGSKSSSSFRIFDIVYSLKPQGGSILYEEIIKVAKSNGLKKITNSSILRALSGESAIFFNSGIEIPRVLPSGIELITPSKSFKGKGIDFNNDK